MIFHSSSVQLLIRFNFIYFDSKVEETIKAIKQTSIKQAKKR